MEHTVCPTLRLKRNTAFGAVSKFRLPWLSYGRSESCEPAQECVRCHSCLFSINQLNFYFQPPSHWAGGKHTLGQICWKPSPRHTLGCGHSQGVGHETPENRESCSVSALALPTSKWRNWRQWGDRNDGLLPKTETHVYTQQFRFKILSGHPLHTHTHTHTPHNAY